jgi:poly(hydroxyalkanoate) granule-associated protein
VAHDASLAAHRPNSPINTDEESNMVKKLKALADKQAVSNSNLAGTVKDSAQQIWLAGLGAFAKAQEEGGKVFEALVKEGTSLQKKTQNVAEERMAEATSKMTGMADAVTAKAGQQWDKLEGIFEERVSKALSKLGVPTHSDIAELKAQIAALSKSAKTVSKSLPKTVVAAAKKPAAKKAVAKRAAR